MAPKKTTRKRSKKGTVAPLSIAAATKQFDRAAKSLARAMKTGRKGTVRSSRSAVAMLAASVGTESTRQEFLSDVELIGRVATTKADRQASRSRAISTWYGNDWGTFAREDGDVPGWSLTAFAG